MENFCPPFTYSSTTTSYSSPSSTLESFSSLPSYNPMLSHLPPNPHLQHQPYFSCPPPVSSSPISSSAAIDSRRARQRRVNILKTKKSARIACSSSSGLSIERESCNAGSETQNKQHLYPFCTSDNKKLRLLFKKELKNSDVGSLGRIVLPKKEAEMYLPSLSNKDGIDLRIRDAFSTQEWGLRYKYWRNNKTRMYVLENTGNFVRESGVEVGDIIHLYEDECKNLYVSIHRHEARPVHVAEPSSTLYHQRNYTAVNTITTIDDTFSKTIANTTSIYAYNATPTDDGSTSTIVLQRQLQRDEQLVETNNMVTLSTDPAPSYRQSEEASNSNDDVTRQQQTSTHQPVMAEIFGSLPSLTTSPGKGKISEYNFTNFFEGLETLPDIHRF